jgi:SAM-dependent methyltransferase
MASVQQITRNRWEVAQKAEKDFWDGLLRNPREFLEIIYQKYCFLSKINLSCPQALKPVEPITKIVEIGIGPMAIGVASLLEPPDKWLITGVDPLPRIYQTKLPPYLDACFNKLIDRCKYYIQEPAEKFKYAQEVYDLAICYNVLDHTRNPEKILENIFNMLVPGGYFLLGVDISSFVGKYRAKLLKYEDIYHPFRFTFYDIVNLLHSCGFKISFFQKDNHEFLKRIYSRKRRLAFVARKPLK